MRLIFFLLFPIFLSAQITRSYGVIEIGGFPISSTTGPKFAYNPADSSFYRWRSGSTWVKVIEPSIISAGWGIIKTGLTYLVDSSKVASRYYVSTSPTTIAANYVATSNGTNLVGFGSLTYASSLLKLTNTTSASTIRVEDSGNANIYASISPTGFGLSRASDGTSGNSGAFYKVADQIAGISARTSVLLMNDTRAFLQINGTGVTVEAAAALNSTISNNNASSVFAVRGTTLSSSPFPLHSTAQSNAITGVNGNFEYITDGIGPALSWYNGTRKAYALESTFARGTSTYVPFFDANGQLTQNAGFTYNGSQLFVSGGTSSTVLDVRVQTSPQGMRFKSYGGANDGRSGIYFYDSGGERSILAARPSGGGGTEYLGLGQGGVLSFGGITSPLGIQFSRIYQMSTLFGDGDDGQSLIIAGANQGTGSGGSLLNQMGGSSTIFDIATERKASARLQGVRSAIEFTASSFIFTPNEGSGGVRSLAQTTAKISMYANYFTKNTNFGSSSEADNIAIIDTKTTTRGSKPFPIVTTAQRNLLAGRLHKITITNGGTGYGSSATAVTLTISGGGGSGATAIGYSFNGVILFAIVTNEGSGYTSTPTVTVGGSGSGATATASITSHVDGLGVYNSDTKTYQYYQTTNNRWQDNGSYQSDNLDVVDSTRLQNTPPHTSITGLLTRDATGWIGLSTFGNDLKYSAGVLGLKRKSLIDSLPIASVTIDAAGNDLTIDNLNNLDFTTDGGDGSMQLNDLTFEVEAGQSIVLSSYISSLRLDDEVELYAPNLEGVNRMRIDSFGFHSTFTNTLADPDSAMSMITSYDRGLLKLHKYGKDNHVATITGEYSERIAGLTPSGVVQDFRLTRDTFIEDVTLFAVGTLLHDCQELTIVSSMTVLAPSNQEIRIPDAADYLRGKKIIVYSKKKDGGSFVPFISVVGGVSRLFYTTDPGIAGTDPIDHASLYIDNSTWSDHGTTYEFTCLKIDNTPSYRWVLKQR